MPVRWVKSTSPSESSTRKPAIPAVAHMWVIRLIATVKYTYGNAAEGEDIEQPYAEVQRPVKKFTFKFLPNCFHVAAFWRGNSLFEIVLCLRRCRQNLPKQT